MRAQVRKISKTQTEQDLQELGNIILEGDEYALVRKMKAMVPEYISNNSVFSSLDAKR